MKRHVDASCFAVSNFAIQLWKGLLIRSRAEGVNMAIISPVDRGFAPLPSLLAQWHSCSQANHEKVSAFVNQLLIRCEPFCWLYESETFQYHASSGLCGTLYCFTKVSTTIEVTSPSKAEVTITIATSFTEPSLVKIQVMFAIGRLVTLSMR